MLAEGKWPYVTPFGYSKIKNANPNLQPDDNAKYVSQIFNMAAQGAKSKEIVSLGARQGIKINRSHIASILANHLYYGAMINSRENAMNQGGFLPIISKQLFDNAKQAMSTRKAKPRRIFNEFPLTGFVYHHHFPLKFHGYVTRASNKYYRVPEALGTNINAIRRHTLFLNHLESLFDDDHFQNLPHYFLKCHQEISYLISGMHSVLQKRIGNAANADELQTWAFFEDKTRFVNFGGELINNIGIYWQQADYHLKI